MHIPTTSLLNIQIADIAEGRVLVNLVLQFLMAVTSNNLKIFKHTHMKISTSSALTPSDRNAFAKNQTYRHQTRPALYIPLFFALLILISAGANAQSTSYCEPLYSGSYGGYIEYVQLGTINTSAPAPNYTTNLAQGSAQRLIVSAAAGTGSNEYIFANVWIDYNADGDFNDGGEHIASTSLPSNGIRYFAITFTVPDNAVPGPTRMRIRTSVNHYDGEGPCDYLSTGEAEDYIVTIIVPPSCTGTPVLGSAVTSNAGPVCSGTSINLSLNPYPGSATIAYQWEVSTAGASGPFTAIPGQTYTTATITGQTQNSWYRLRATCNTSGLSTASAAVNVAQQPDISACYCVPTITNSGYYYNIYINSLQLGTINNTTGLNASSYTSYLSAPTATQTTDLIQGSPQTITVEVHGGDLNRHAPGAAAWIDYNRDGDFDDPGERVFKSYFIYTNRVVAGFTVPANAVPGPTRLRIVGGFNTIEDPCFQSSPGEAEDYLVTIVTPCSVQPVTTTVTASGPTTFCQSGSVTLTASGADTYLWSTGATTSSITVATAGSYSVTGTNTIGCSNTTAPVTVTTTKLANAGTDGTLTVCTGSTPTEAQLFAAITGEDAGGLWSGPVNNIYTYTVSATPPCTVTDVSTVTITTQAAPNAGTNGVLTLCEGTTLTSAQLFAALGGSPTTGGSWSPTLAGAGTYTYTVAAIAPCTGNATATVTVTTIDKTINAGCFSATVARTYNTSANTTTFTYNACANSCTVSLGYIAFITQTNIRVVTPLNGASYKTAKYTYKVSVPVGVENGKTIYGIKYELTSKGEGIKNKGECDNFTFTLAGNIVVNAITVQFKAGKEVIKATADCPLNSSSMTQATISSKTGAGEQIHVAPAKLNVSTYPNPYTDKVKFVIQSPVSGLASLEVFNMLGQKVQTVFTGQVKAGRGQSLEYNVPVANRGNLIYILRVGNQKATGRLIHPN